MLYVLLGEDDYSLRRSLEKIKDGIGDETALATNTAVLEGNQVTVSELRNACETVPFLAERRLVIVEGLLRRFESRDRPGQRKKPNLSKPRDGYEVMVSCLGQLPDFTIVVLIDGKVSNRNPLFKGLSAVSKVLSFPPLRGAKLQQWIQQRVKAAGGSISLPAVNLLVRFVGSNLWIMANEVDKLVLFAAGRRIEEEDIVAVVSYAQEASVFVLVDAILESRAGMAAQLLQRLLQQGAAPAYLLVMLSRQVQILVRVKELIKQGKSRMEMQDRLGLTSDFVLRKALEQVGRYSLERLKEVYHHLLEADLAIKTGRYDGELALTILIAELCQRGRVLS